MDYIGDAYKTAREYNDELAYGLGSMYPMPGGLKENVKWFLGEDVSVRQVEGEHEAYRFLDEYKPSSDSPIMIDILNCGNGCLFGTGTQSGVDGQKVYAEMSRQRKLQRLRRKKLDLKFKKYRHGLKMRARRKDTRHYAGSLKILTSMTLSEIIQTER